MELPDIPGEVEEPGPMVLPKPLGPDVSELPPEGHELLLLPLPDELLLSVLLGSLFFPRCPCLPLCPEGGESADESESGVAHPLIQVVRKLSNNNLITIFCIEEIARIFA